MLKKSCPKIVVNRISQFCHMKIRDHCSLFVSYEEPTLVSFNGTLCCLTTSFVSFQNWQYVTMNVVYLPSILNGPSSPPFSCAQHSINYMKLAVLLWRFGPACSEQQILIPHFCMPTYMKKWGVAPHTLERYAALQDLTDSIK